MRRYIFIVIGLWIASCSAPALGTVAPVQQPITIGYPPSLEPILKAIYLCTETHPELSVIVEKRPISAIDFNANDITLWFGDKPEVGKFTTPLSFEELVFIANLDNPNEELSADEIRSLFNGQVRDWSEISDFRHPVSVWIYPDGNLLQKMILAVLFEDEQFSLLAHLASHPQAMLESIASDRGSIGFLPNSWLDDSVSKIKINQEARDPLRKPILAITKKDPQGSIHTLLACMQTGAGQEAIHQIYSLDQ